MAASCIGLAHAARYELRLQGARGRDAAGLRNARAANVVPRELDRGVTLCSTYGWGNGPHPGGVSRCLRRCFQVGRPDKQFPQQQRRSHRAEQSQARAVRAA